MHKLPALALLIAGILLIAYGVSAANSVSSEISSLITGSPTSQALWMLIGGAVATVVGVIWFAGGSGSKRKGTHGAR
jgi:hypothetical protein